MKSDLIRFALVLSHAVDAFKFKYNTLTLLSTGQSISISKTRHRLVGIAFIHQFDSVPANLGS